MCAVAAKRAPKTPCCAGHCTVLGRSCAGKRTRRRCAACGSMACPTDCPWHAPCLEAKWVNHDSQRNRGGHAHDDQRRSTTSTFARFLPNGGRRCPSGARHSTATCANDSGGAVRTRGEHDRGDHLGRGVIRERIGLRSAVQRSSGGRPPAGGGDKVPPPRRPISPAAARAGAESARSRPTWDANRGARST